MDVRVESPPADHVAAGRRHAHVAVAREQRACEQERRADVARELLVDLGADVVRVHAHIVVAGPLDLGAEVTQQLDHRFDVADPRHG